MVSTCLPVFDKAEAEVCAGVHTSACCVRGIFAWHLFAEVTPEHIQGRSCYMMFFPRFLFAALWGLVGFITIILVVYWVYTIQARMGELVREVREIKELLRRD